MKKVVAYIFIIIFLFSALPVREIGKMLGKGQTTEEVHADDDGTGVPDDDFAGKIKKDLDPFIEVIFHAEVAPMFVYNNKVQVAIHRSSILPDHFVPNIPTPPPDFC